MNDSTSRSRLSALALAGLVFGKGPSSCNAGSSCSGPARVL